ncbi:FecR domain-containing protein [Aquimarina sp. W85]|uniref:FecR domain-containing protein n=1 Tax=Aquimarina rhodophyticola TaxID=3342246 RepID=UPI003672784A
MHRIVCVFMFLLSVLAFSQEKTNTLTFNNASLVSALPQIETYFNVSFSYIDQVVNGKFISLTISENSKVASVIKSIEQQALIKIETIKETNFAIRPYKSNDQVALCGTLIDEQQNPLKQVSIRIIPENKIVTTDTNGNFVAEQLLYNSILEIDLPGYVKKRISASEIFSNSCALIEISTIEFSLDQVFIKDFLAKGISLNHKTIQIKISDLQALPGLTEPDILYSIQLAPGVNSPYETASGLHVRGSTPHQNLVLWNGIKTYHHAHLYGMLSAFNPYAVDDVLFYKSGIPENYGDRLASVVDIRSSSKITNKFKGSIGMNMINSDAIIDIPLIKDKLSVKLTGRRSFTDLLETFTYKKLADRAYQNTKIQNRDQSVSGDNTFYFLDYNTTVNYNATKRDTLQINTLYSKNKLRFDQDSRTLKYSDKLITENEGYNIKWHHSYHPNFNQKTSFYYTKYGLNYTFAADSITKNIEIRTKENNIRELGTNVILKYLSGTKSNISTGYQYIKKYFKHGFATTTPDYFLILDQDDRTLDIHAAHLGYQFDDAQNWFVSTGIRLNHYSGLDKTYIEPRIVIQKQITSSIEINATTEFRSQSDSNIRESVISDLTLENEIWKLADTTNFPISTSTQYSIGGSFKKKGWNFNTDFYHKQIKGLTTLTAGFINPIDNQYHDGKSEIYGVDIFIKKKIKRFNSWLSYSYINTQNFFTDVNNNNYFPGNWNIRHSLRWTSFYDLDHLRFSLGWTWHSGKAYTQVREIINEQGQVTLQYGELNSSTLPIYHRMDLSVIYNFKLKESSKLNYRFAVSIRNLYDRKNLINKEFRSANTLDNKFSYSDMYGIRLTPNLSFRILW